MEGKKKKTKEVAEYKRRERAKDHNKRRIKRRKTKIKTMKKQMEQGEKQMTQTKNRKKTSWTKEKKINERS